MTGLELVQLEVKLAGLSPVLMEILVCVIMTGCSLTQEVET